MPDALPSAERTNSATIEGLLLYEAVELKEWGYAYSRAAASIERGEHEESGDGR